ncbi:MAG: tRNA-(ms[2]io[6]A)-hydroxylase [bacterium]|nr:tRNA-(ms[2]io[6]A)-hydroxylase [bacterium]
MPERYTGSSPTATVSGPQHPYNEAPVFGLRTETSPEWVETALGDFDSFLMDHAICERKASATAMSFISHYPDRRELVEEMLGLAQMELDHFRETVGLLHARNLVLGRDEKDLYINSLRKEIRNGREEYFLDRLLLAGIIEARGCERFGKIAAALEAGELKEFYRRITRDEAQHVSLFLRLAETYFPAAAVQERHGQLLDREGQILQDLPLRPVVH